MSAQKLIIISILCLLATICCIHGETTTLTTPLLIQREGYPVEEHKVQTSDGYILTMHRIPYSPYINNTQATQRPVAFVMHGIICASSVWVLNGRKSSLAFILSDAGYDVWLGNQRGNLYSMEHVSLSPATQAFWNFEFQQIAIYDIPAMIDYARNVTGVKQVRYIGHSQGTTTFFVLNALQPSYVKERIRSAHLLAPVAFISHATEVPINTIGVPFGVPNPTVEVSGSREFLPSTRAFQLAAEAKCNDGEVTQAECSSLLFLVFGGVSPYLNTTQLPQIGSVIPAGSSINQVIHYTQLFNTGTFRQFDFGTVRNLKEYGSTSPPDYNLSNLNAPTYFYHSDNDILADPTDVGLIVDKLSPTGNLKGVYRVPLTKWNHIDFLFGLDIENVVYNKVLNDLADS